ncbi:hypothetical protein KXV85_003385, partial [Aspergillus fumigatus]
GSYVNYFRHPPNTKRISGFGQAEVPLTDKLTAVVGGRYTQDDRDAAFTNYFFAFGSGPIELTNQPSSTTPLKYSGSKFTWLAGLNYKPNSSTLIYGKVSTGYKAGGFSAGPTPGLTPGLTVDPALVPLLTYKPEELTAFDLGIKNSFFDRKLTLNLEAFWWKYKNQQVQTIFLLFLPSLPPVIVPSV